MALIIVNGRLGGLPEKKQSKNGAAYCTFSLATSEKKAGKDETTWYRCIWMNTEHAGILSFLDKGSLVAVVGRLQKPKVFQKKDGSQEVDLTIFVNDVTFLPLAKPSEKGSVAQSASVHGHRGESKIEDFSQDEMPF